MIPAPVIAHERNRLESLRKLQLLDSPIEERFERITRMACRTLDMPIVAFTLVDETRQTFKSVQGMPAADVPRGDSFCGHVVAGDTMLLVPDTQKDDRFFDNPLVNSDPGIGFYAGCPVRAPDGEKIGVLCAIDSAPRELTPQQIESLHDFASMVETELRAAMLSNAQTELMQELNLAQRSALVDPLTRLWNRNGISELLKKEWAHAIENKSPLAVVVADIDHFKAVNDTYGHPAGDEVLRQVGQHLLSKLRADDIIGRLGGEEFLLVLPKCQLTHLRSAMERIRQFVQDTPFTTRAGDLRITLSFGGLSTLPDASASIEQFIGLADEALYAAKRNGRNRVEIAQV